MNLSTLTVEQLNRAVELRTEMEDLTRQILLRKAEMDQLGEIKPTKYSLAVRPGHKAGKPHWTKTPEGRRRQARNLRRRWRNGEFA